ncbi:MAG TPA: tyrosine-type recombinase/integrase [Gemmataceae bacterium]|jgi:integrase|nr:tyrosine-type recombinase/integrase [Gemmataceae bacterium]
MSRRASTFKIGKVQVYLRSNVWYLCYHEHGKRQRPRVGNDLAAAKQLAAQVNAQLAIGSPAATSFQAIAIPELRRLWLEHHEHVLRSSVHTINRYRTATDHLLRFLEHRPVRHASHFHVAHAESFVRHFRQLEVSPNGHLKTAKRPLMDKGLRYILECCRALFSFAAKRRHLPPYADNPFSALEVDRIPIERARPIHLMTLDQERAFLEACDDWQFPLFLTLLLTGLRPGEACHLLLPDDVDLDEGVVRIRNKPALGWQVKTRCERDIPLIPVLANVLRVHVAGRQCGPVFRRRRWCDERCTFDISTLDKVAIAAKQRIDNASSALVEPITRAARGRVLRRLWWDLGAIKEDRVRTEFMRLTTKIGLPDQTAPKALRHMFATALQDGRVDPLIRNLLMGHAAANSRTAGHGLGMTAVYSHSRPATIRQQLEEAMAARSAISVTRRWIEVKAGKGD